MTLAFSFQRHFAQCQADKGRPKCVTERVRWKADVSFPHLFLFRLRTELRPSEQTPTRRTSRRAVEAVQAAWGRTREAAWTHREARVVTQSEPPTPGSRNTARHWCSSLTTRMPTQWVIIPFLLIFLFVWCVTILAVSLLLFSGIVCFIDCFLPLLF